MIAGPSIVGETLLERMRRSTIALLSVVTAVGLATIGFAASQGFPEFLNSPLPKLPEQSVGEAQAVAGPAGPAGHLLSARTPPASAVVAVPRGGGTASPAGRGHAHRHAGAPGGQSQGPASGGSGGHGGVGAPASPVTPTTPSPAAPPAAAPPVAQPSPSPPATTSPPAEAPAPAQQAPGPGNGHGKAKGHEAPSAPVSGTSSPSGKAKGGHKAAGSTTPAPPAPPAPPVQKSAAHAAPESAPAPVETEAPESGKGHTAGH
jgi:hypothetical protein